MGYSNINMHFSAIRKEEFGKLFFMLMTVKLFMVIVPANLLKGIRHQYNYIRILYTRKF